MKVEIDRDDLRPLIEVVVSETLQRMANQDQKLGRELSYTEPQAASLLGVPRHSLRDARLRGEVSGSRIGKRIVYSVDQLKKFLRDTEIS